MRISPFFFKTKGDNWYFFSPSCNKVLLCHQSIKFFYDINCKGEDIQEIIEQCTSLLVLEDGLKLTKNELKYYYGKYQFFCENNFFKSVDIKEKLNYRISSEQIKRALATTDTVCFEVSEQCNLHCRYCAYGKMYSNNTPRETRNGDPVVAKKFLLYLNEIKSEYGNGEIKNEFRLGFYGGEPLLNFPFIKEVVSYAEELSLEGNTVFDFIMTTNGIFLDKYIDFLVAHDFKLTISLDGDSNNNEFRVFANGKSSFPIVIKNIKYIREKHPDYFEEKVGFNAVLHNKNSMDDIYSFFKENFNKTPFFSEVSSFWIKNSSETEFNEIYKNCNNDLKSSECYHEIESDMFWLLPNIKSLKMFIQMYSGSAYKTYPSLFIDRNSGDFKIYPSGTCIPFSKRIFITVDGRLLPCENIGNQNYFDIIHKDNVEIDFDKVAEKFNGNLDRLSQCNNCYKAPNCENCLYNFLTSDKVEKCIYFADRNKYAMLMAERMSVFESKPSLYYKLLTEEEINE